MSPSIATHEIRVALEERSIIEFVDALQAIGLEFYVRGKNPSVRDISDGSRHRLRSLGILPEFLRSLSRWDAFEYGLDFTADDGDLLELRLHWMAGCEFRADIPTAEFKSMRYFLRTLGFDDVKDSMTIAQRKIEVGRLDDRFRYFCGICHTKIKGE